ncbi:unnamed protein product [Cylicocyclus nassatus]|uniref:Uncharacterized protein n=1 Tax=Cylicocyclus nassatus TaxID=53992 RepID=A0AA36HCD3_CYLNA|nr:unnamed protein product [Cylicocyclus nassatus]
MHDPNRCLAEEVKEVPNPSAQSRPGQINRRLASESSSSIVCGANLSETDWFSTDEVASVDLLRSIVAMRGKKDVQGWLVRKGFCKIVTRTGLYYLKKKKPKSMKYRTNKNISFFSSQKLVTLLTCNKYSIENGDLWLELVEKRENDSDCAAQF